MSEQKCFCHLNGYAVKDATARADIETLKTGKVSHEELENAIQVVEGITNGLQEDIENLDTRFNYLDIPDKASDLAFETGTSGIVATTVQGAIEEVNRKASSVEQGTAQGTTFDNSSNGMEATNVQSAIEEVKSLAGNNSAIAEIEENLTIDFSNSTATSVKQLLQYVADKFFRVILNLFKNGVVADGFNFSGYSSTSVGAYAITNNITLSATATTQDFTVCGSKVDLTNFNTLTAKGKFAGNSNYAIMHLTVNTELSHVNQITSKSYQKSTVSTNECTFSIDVSELSGEYYVNVMLQTPANESEIATFSEIVLN